MILASTAGTLTTGGGHCQFLYGNRRRKESAETARVEVTITPGVIQVSLAKQQHPIEVLDQDGTVLGEYYADLCVERELIIEVVATFPVENPR